jgi:hypothetical protein
MPPTPGIRVLNETKTFHLERKRCNFSISKSSGDKKKTCVQWGEEKCCDVMRDKYLVQDKGKINLRGLNSFAKKLMWMEIIGFDGKIFILKFLI